MITLPAFAFAISDALMATILYIPIVNSLPAREH